MATLHLVPIVSGSNDSPLFLIAETEEPHGDHMDLLWTHLGWDSRDTAFSLYLDGDSKVRGQWDDIRYWPSGAIDSVTGPIVPMMDGTFVR